MNESKFGSVCENSEKINIFCFQAKLLTGVKIIAKNMNLQQFFNDCQYPQLDFHYAKVRDTSGVLPKK